jgi:hypothetical protein
MNLYQLIQVCIACFACMLITRLAVTVMRFAVSDDTMFPEFSRDAQREREAEFFVRHGLPLGAVGLPAGGSQTRRRARCHPFFFGRCGVNARTRRQVESFFARVESRIEQERSLAAQDGLRRTAREAASERADQLARDLSYLRATYTSHRVMVGEGAGA